MPEEKKEKFKGNIIFIISLSDKTFACEKTHLLKLMFYHIEREMENVIRRILLE